MVENVPPINAIPEDEMEKIKQQLGLIAAGSSESSSQDIPTPVRRKRGRPRKYHYEDGKATSIPLDAGEVEEKDEFGTLPSPKLTTRDSKEVANRLKGILVGSTGIGAVLNPAIQMTEKEAENIATPLTAYLVRTEATSQMAKRVLNEYDLTAFVIATLAYMVRVVKDMRSEREATEPEQQSGRRILQRVPTSQRVAESTDESTSSPTTGENEDGQEGTNGREWPIPYAAFRGPTEV